MPLSNENVRVLRAALGAFAKLEERIRTAAYPDLGFLETVHQVVQQTQERVPGVLPPFKPEAFQDSSAALPVRSNGLRSYIDIAISMLSSALEGEGSIPLDQLLDFSYVKDANLRSILQRDHRELLRALNAKCWKSALVLSGALIEAILIDQLDQSGQAAFAASAAPLNKPDISSWRFVDVIKVAVELRVVSKGADKLSHSIRDYRNLIHLHAELRDKLLPEDHEARIAVNLLDLIDRDLQS